MSDLIDIGYFWQPGGNSYVEQICPTGEFIKNIEGESSLDYLKKLNFTCSDGTKLSTIGSNSINQPALPVTFSMTYDPAMDHIYGTSDLYVSQLFGNGGKGGKGDKGDKGQLTSILKTAKTGSRWSGKGKKNMVEFD
jgi:hypothetical protein